MKRGKHRNFHLVVHSCVATETMSWARRRSEGRSFSVVSCVDVWSLSRCTICCLPRHVVRKLGSEWCSDMGYHKQHLALLLVQKTNPILKIPSSTLKEMCPRTSHSSVHLLGPAFLDFGKPFISSCLYMFPCTICCVPGFLHLA